MRKYIKFILIAIESAVIFILLWGNVVTLVKHIETMVLVDSFKAKGVLDEEKSTKSVKFYKIESDEELPTYLKYGDYIVPGNVGDILVSPKSLMYVSGNTVIDSFIVGILSWYAGGHAAIATGDYFSYDIGNANVYSNVESTGMEEGENPATLGGRIYWQNRENTEVIGLRCKTTKEERDELISMATSLVGDPYNYSFIFDIDNTSYCSDLIAKCYAKIGKNINKDSFATTIYDIIVSGDVYISYHHYFDSDNVKHIYYLG